MSFDPRRWPSIVGLVAGISLVTSCSSGEDNGGNTGPPPPTPPPSAVTVTTATAPPPIFIPSSITVAVGGTVTWRNTSPAGAHHNVTSTTGLFQSPDFDPGQTFEQVFPEAGIFPYRCTIHAGMVGTVVVQ